ncbi:PEP-CTERM sorting domain-containing protein [Candidatus Auribacterota bacterium]
MDTDGGNYSLLYSFLGGADDGEYAWGSLIKSDTILYGMTFQGGDSGAGVVFGFDLEGSGEVPEPSTLLLLLPLLGGLYWMRRRRKGE